MRTTLFLQVALLAAAAHAQPGTLDASFGTNGETLHSLGSPFDLIWDLAVQPDDKIVVAGSVGAIGGGAYQDAFITRFTADGAVDSTFGTNGTVIWTGTGGNDRIRGVDIDVDGNVVVAGETQVNGGETQMFIIRLLPDGTFDSSFSGDGVLTRPGSVYNDGSYARDVKCMPDGSILVGGYEHYNLSMPNHNAVSFWKCTTTGAAPGNFGGSATGYTFADLFNNDLDDVANGMAVRADGSIVVGTQTYDGSYQRMGYATFNADGSHLSNNDEATYDFTVGNEFAYSIVLLPDERCVLAGGVTNQAGLVGVLPFGPADPTFGTAGKVNVQLGSSSTSLYAALLQPWDKVLITGALNDGGPNTVYLARYTNDGSPDAVFGSGGVATHLPGGTGGDGRGIGLQSDGRIVVAGNYYNGSDIDLFVLRFNNDFALGQAPPPPAPVLRAFPSPFAESLTVVGTAAGGTLTLVDALGRAVLTAPTTEGRTEVQADVPTGCYTVQYQRGAVQCVLRVVRG